MPVRQGRTTSDLMMFLALAACLLAVAGVIDTAFAQAGPFGRPAGPPPASDGLIGWLFAKQAEFYRGLSTAIRAAKADHTAILGLLGLSFAYGIFHAAGPGHGKAVISSYVIANQETWRRGVVLSFASALLQALVAIAIVGIAAWLIGATRQTICKVDPIIEIASYGLIAAIGARLLWVKGRGFLGALRATRHGPLPAPVGAAVTAGHDHHHHDHNHHDHDHSHHHHVHDAACGHDHGPDPASLAGPGGWRRGLSAIVAVGLRPCSGAILVLVFALAQGVFWAGAAATLVMGLGTAITVAAIATLAVSARTVAVKLATGRTGYGALAIRGIEVAAAALVLAFGVLLLVGYMASERLVGLC